MLASQVYENKRKQILINYQKFWMRKKKHSQWKMYMIVAAIAQPTQRIAAVAHYESTSN